MKIAIVTRYPEDPAAPHGGVEAVSVNLVRGLAQHDDLNVQVVTTDPQRSAVSRYVQDNAVIHRLPRLGWSTLTDAIRSGRRLLNRYVRELAPDVVHAHDVYGLMVKCLPLPRVFTIHGFIYGDTLVSGERFAWLRSRIWRRIETAGWADQPHIISISPYVRERLNGIYHGVMHDVDNPIANAFFDIERCEQKGVIFSAAHICPRKNTLGLIEAFARLAQRRADAHLRLAGPEADEEYSRRVRQRIGLLGLDDRVSLLGRISTHQVQHELAAASIFALVSVEENSPMGIEEAMAVGVPVVTSNCCGMPYLVRDGETGFLVDPHDPDDVAQRLEALLANDVQRARMGAQARRVALDRFHPDVIAWRTRAIYQRAFESYHRSHDDRQPRTMLALDPLSVSSRVGHLQRS